MPTITLGFDYEDGDQVSPNSLHRLVEEATISGFSPSDFNLGSIKFWTYGSTRPALERGAVHYDTTPGIEGLYYAWVSQSNASLSYWLCAMPRRECICWIDSACSPGTPLFAGAPNASSVWYRVYDGCVFPLVTFYTGASGPNAAYYLALEAGSFDRPVKCMWAGIVPDPVLLLNTGSGPSSGHPLFINYASAGGHSFGQPSQRNFIFGIAGPNSNGAGSVIWGNGPCLEDIV